MNSHKLFQTDLANVLCLCEPQLLSQLKGTSNAIAQRRANLENIRLLLRVWKQGLEDPDEDDDFPDTLYYIPTLRDAGAASLNRQLAPIVDDLDVPSSARNL